MEIHHVRLRGSFPSCDTAFYGVIFFAAVWLETGKAGRDDAETLNYLSADCYWPCVEDWVGSSEVFA